MEGRAAGVTARVANLNPQSSLLNPPAERLMRRELLSPANIGGVLTDMRSDYAAGKAGRFQRVRTGLNLLGSGADYHYQSQTAYLRTLEYARDMARNDTVVGSIVDRSVWNVLQRGFAFDPQTGNPELDSELKLRFNDWAEDPAACDAGGRFTLGELTEQAGRAVKIDGDVFALPREDGTLQLVEAHRCRTPGNTRRNVVLGVLLDEQRRALEYWFTKDDIDPLRSLSRVSEIKQYAARDEDGHELVFHVYDPRRCTQTRGVTAFAPVFDSLGMLEDIHFAQLVKAQVAACFVILRESGPEFAGGPRGQTGPRTSEQMSDGEQRTVESLAPGLEIQGRPGETIKGFSPTVPNAEYFEHAKFTLQLICACVNLPLISFLLDGKETNFSGWRGAIDQAKIGWRREQQLIIRHLSRKVYAWKLRQFAARDRVLAAALAELGADYFRVRVNPPTWPYIQPIQDIEAARREREALLTSPRRQSNERAADWDELIDETVADNERAIGLAIAAAQRIEAATGAAIDPIRFLYIDTKKPLLEQWAQEAALGKELTPGERKASEELDFKREVVKGFIADGTIGDVMFNRVAAGELLRAVNIPVYHSADGQEIEEPWLPIITADGQTVSGEALTDSGDAVVGGEVIAGSGLDSYGTGVRAGTLTPQDDDETHFRQSMGLPGMNEDTKEAWKSGARRPVTLAENEDDTEDGDETEGEGE